MLEGQVRDLHLNGRVVALHLGPLFYGLALLSSHFDRALDGWGEVVLVQAVEDAHQLLLVSGAVERVLLVDAVEDLDQPRGLLEAHNACALGSDEKSLDRVQVLPLVGVGLIHPPLQILNSLLLSSDGHMEFDHKIDIILALGVDVQFLVALLDGLRAKLDGEVAPYE